MKLHYAKIDFEGDIPCYEFRKQKEADNFVDEITYPYREGIVYLLAIGDDREVIVTSDRVLLWELFGKSKSKPSRIDPHLQENCYIFEFGSFEEAYSLALDLKETSPLCYDKKRLEKLKNE